MLSSSSSLVQQGSKHLLMVLNQQQGNATRTLNLARSLQPSASSFSFSSILNQQNQRYLSAAAANKYENLSTKEKTMTKKQREKESGGNIGSRKGKKMTLAQKVQLKALRAQEAESAAIAAAAKSGALSKAATATAPTATEQVKKADESQKSETAADASKTTESVAPKDATTTATTAATEVTAAPVTPAATEIKKAEVKPKSKVIKPAKPLAPLQAIAKMRKLAKNQLPGAKFDESVELSLILRLDTRKADQQLRTSAELPNGTGRKVRVLVFAEGDKAEEAKKAGAQIVGMDDLIKKIKDENFVAFDKCISTPEALPKLKTIAKVLGPRGLMPNKKAGSVTDEIALAVTSSLKGSLDLKVGMHGLLNAAFGKLSFTDKALAENLRSIMIALFDNKPAGAKGKFITKATIKSTQGKPVALNIQTIDPSSQLFMQSIDARNDPVIGKNAGSKKTDASSEKSKDKSETKAATKKNKNEKKTPVVPNAIIEKKNDSPVTPAPAVNA